MYFFCVSGNLQSYPARYFKICTHRKEIKYIESLLVIELGHE